MRMPRLTVRRMMVVVAVAALASFVWEEFQDGLPPRFVNRRIAARVTALERGMTFTQVQARLVTDRHWLRGGITNYFEIVPDGESSIVALRVLPAHSELRSLPPGTSIWSETSYSGLIELTFSRHEDGEQRLDDARYVSRDGRPARMAASSRESTGRD